MTEYNFFSLADVVGGKVRTRWQLEAESFADACILAQELEEDPDILYTEFVEVVSCE